MRNIRETTERTGVRIHIWAIHAEFCCSLSAVCNAFLNGLPELLDTNLVMSKQVTHQISWYLRKKNIFAMKILMQCNICAKLENLNQFLMTSKTFWPLSIWLQLLPVILQVLLHLPSPQKMASDQHATGYSLYLLSRQSRHLWLNSLTLLLYKYRFDQPPISDHILKLISILVRTLQVSMQRTGISFLVIQEERTRRC